MAGRDKVVRQSVSIPERIVRRVRSLAKRRKTSASRVIVHLIEAGLDSQEAQKKRFFTLADELMRSRDPRERESLKQELARMTFGE